MFHWDFGDQQFSEEEDPQSVIYSQYGSFEVCLTVSNEYGENTFCRTIELMDTITSVNNLSSDLFSLQPNPFNSILQINAGHLNETASIIIFNSLGEMVLTETLQSGSNEIATSHLQDGVYLYTISSRTHTMEAGKLVKMH